MPRHCARFIDRVDFRAALLLESGRPAQERSFAEALRWLRVAAAFLHDHRVKLLVDIDSKLDHRFARIKLRAGSLG